MVMEGRRLPPIVFVSTIYAGCILDAIEPRLATFWHLLEGESKYAYLHSTPC